MKKTKKLLALVMAFVMVMAMATTALADGKSSYTITVPANDSHTYEVYQIFTGDYYDGVLSNLVWGVNGTGTADEKVDPSILEELAAVNSAADVDKLAVISKYVSLDSALGTVSAQESLTVAPGYYLLKDADGSLNAQDDAYTTYIVQIVDDVTVERKAAQPSVDKQVWDDTGDDDTHEKGDNNWGETADHEIKEVFQFKLTATIPADKDFAAYKSYKIVFTDTMSAGLTFDSIKSVTVNGTEISGYTETASNAETKAGLTWTLTIEDLLKYDADLTDGCTVEVIYNAYLNENAVVGNVDDNENTVKLQYSNNPNVSGSGEGEELGETSPDTVWVFTYELDATKVNGASKQEDGSYAEKLSGAQFVLLNSTKDKVAIVDAENKMLSWADIPAANASGEIAWADNMILTSGENGEFTIIGLDHGTYYLQEIKAPNGYNLLEEPYEVIINAVHEEATSEDTATTEFKVNNETAIVVENNKGAQLPETGGIGTTIFYAVGGVMVLAAIVLLVTKKRMASEE